MKRSPIVALALLLALAPALARAWWNGDWRYRKAIIVDTTVLAEAPRGEISDVTIPVRLHTGNFDFAQLRSDVADLRFVAADDRTPLKHHIEKFDAGAGLAIIWVHVPSVLLDPARPVFYMYYGNPKALTVEDAAGGYGNNRVLVLNFNEADGVPRDASAHANHPVRGPAGSGAPGAILSTPGVLGSGAQFTQSTSIVVPASPSTRLVPGQGVTFTAWVRIDSEQSNAAIFTQRAGGSGIQIGLNGLSLFVRVTEPGHTAGADNAGRLDVGTWHHVAVSLSDHVSVYIDGRRVATADAFVPAVDGEIVLGAPAGGASMIGALDEVTLAKTVRPAEWIQLAAALEKPGSELVRFGEDKAAGTNSTYFAIWGVLARAVTPDGWVIIGIIALLALIAGNVIITKLFSISRMERSNRAFVAEFRRREAEMMGAVRARRSAEAATADTALGLEAQRWQRHSSLYRIYRVAVDQAHALLDGQGAREALDAEALTVVRSTLDASMVEEVHRLNAKLVLLTVTVSGAPFFGLLGTVVGIMMTFGAIAESGDVSVNTIAPGVAAALTTTVAGLLVAIPVMFAYNSVVIRVRALTRTMEVFANELLGKLAYAHGAKR